LLATPGELQAAPLQSGVEEPTTSAEPLSESKPAEEKE